MERNIGKIINKTRGNINRRYDMTMNDGRKLLSNNKSGFSLVYDAFTFGYAQGMKAAKAEMKKKGVVA